MSGDQAGNLIYGLVCLMLVASSLAARRLPLGQTLKMALAWVAIFAAVFAVFSFRYELLAVWNRMKAEAMGSSTAADGTLRLRAGDGGHYFVDAEVNGRAVRFMVDSGATTTSMWTATARAAGVTIDETGFPVVVETANGMAQMQRGRIARLRVGPIERADFPVLVSDTLGDDNLIGMNFLETLKGWRVEGNEMVLNP
jgi:aspartyl protease family protein